MKRTIILLLCFILALSACGQSENAPELVFPEAGELLTGECEPFAPPEDDGSRSVTVSCAVKDKFGGGETQTVYDLPNTETAEDGAVITVQREYLTSTVPDPGAPVTDSADRERILDMTSRAEFGDPDAVSGTWEFTVYIEEDGLETGYRIYPDGTVTRRRSDGRWEAAYGAADRDFISAVAYKYADDARDIGGFDFWLTEVTLKQNLSGEEQNLPDRWDECYPYPPAKNYRLCLQSGDFHADLDREQARLLLKTLFGEGEDGTAVVPEFTPATWDWTPPEDGIRLTERMLTEWTDWENNIHQKDGGIEQVFYLYSDGTVARLAATEMIFNYDRALEFITPSWQRVTIAENAFDPEVLTACMEALGE